VYKRKEPSFETEPPGGGADMQLKIRSDIPVKLYKGGFTTNAVTPPITETHYHYNQEGQLIGESYRVDFTYTHLMDYIWLDDMPLAQVDSCRTTPIA
jgi:hypothetical protein